MKTKIFVLFAVFGLMLNLVGTTFADNSKKKKGNELVALLPASDGVIAMDSKRFFASALPQILSGNKEMLDEVNGKMDEFKTATGIDIRQFDQTAIGISAKEISPTNTSFEAVVLARGKFDADSLASLVKFASEGKYREEKIGNRTIYIFSPKEIIEKNKTAVKNPMLQKVMNMIFPAISGEMAITAYDAKTLAFGTPDRVRLTINNDRPGIDADLMAMVSKNPSAVGSFALNMPKGAAGFLELGDDELGQNIASIRQMFGFMNVVGENTVVSVTAKTLKAENAESLKNSMTALQSVFGDVLGGSKRDDQKVYGRMLKNAKFSSNANQVTLDLQVPQSDINILIGAK